MSKLHVGIFGPGLSGKTTLAKLLSRAMFTHGYRTIVFDPNGEDYGDHAETFKDEALFWARVWSCERCFVVVDEAAETIARDKTLTPLFTRIRHNGHKLCVIGHNGSDLLPVMRRQLTTLYLFQQTEKSAVLWYEDTVLDKGIFECENLKEYEFLHWEKWKPIVKCRLAQKSLE